MTKILARELKLKFVEILNNEITFSYKDGNPFLISIFGNEFYVFLKNISPAYFVNSPDVTGVQLPFSDHFTNIQRKDKIFIILGYDVENDVFVGWNPVLVHGRLNYKQNVSLYSRKSLQTNVKSMQFLEGFLSNNEKIILFKRSLLSEYFKNIRTIFNNDIQISIKDEKSISNFYDAKMHSIEDPLILEKIKPLLQRNKLLESIEVCSNIFQEKYPEMTFRDWYNILNDLYSEYQKK